MNPPPAPGIRSVLAIPAFRRLWAAQFVSIFGDFLAFFAVSSYISFRLHGSPRQVTFVMVSFLVPFAAIGPIAGVFVDRWDPRRTMIASDLIRAALIIAMIFARAPWQFYIVFALLSTISSFFVPAQSVATPLIVPREALISASAAMQQTVQVVRMLSPAVAGALVGYLGERSCYYLDSASFLASATLIGGIVLPAERPHQNKNVRSVVSDMNSGLKYVLGHPVIGFVVMAIAAAMFAISAFASLLAIYVRDVLHTGAYVYGATGAMVGAGTLAGAIAITPFAHRMKHPVRLILVGLIGIAASVCVLASSSITAVALGACFGVGIGASLIVVPAFALLQSEAAPDMRGRVTSISWALFAASQSVAIFFAGDIAARVGIVLLYYGCAALMVVFAAAGWLRLAKLI
jgi:DHA3 family macrolide efflux protein-like MFS transporter